MEKPSKMRFTPTPEVTILTKKEAKRYVLLPQSTSRSKEWAAYSLSDFMGVFTWKGKGGLYKRNAWHLIVGRLPHLKRRLILYPCRRVD
jgi:hypothetical protein